MPDSGLEVELDAAAARFARNQLSLRQQEATRRSAILPAHHRATSPGPSSIAWAHPAAPPTEFLPVITVPPLTALSLQSLARHPTMIDDLRCTDEHQAVELLRLIMLAGRLDYRLACVFRDAGHESIRRCMGPNPAPVILPPQHRPSFLPISQCHRWTRLARGHASTQCQHPVPW